MFILLSDDLDGLVHKIAASVVTMLEPTLHQLKKDIAAMSASLTQQLQDAIASISADVDAVAAEVAALLASVTPGDAITQAQVDALTAIDARLKAIPPVPPAP